MDHIALAHRNTGSGWVIMATDGRAWNAELVSESLPLAAMIDEALALLARHPSADFTFTTRAAHEVWAAPFDQPADIADIRHVLARSTVTIMTPAGAGCWRVMHKKPLAWFTHVDTCAPDDVHDFLRDWPEDADMIEKGLAGPIDVWLRRRWNADAVIVPPTIEARGNVTPLIPRSRTLHSTAGAR